MDISKCPIRNPRIASDPSADKFFESIGISLEYKVVLFLTVCIVVRLLLAYLANIYYDYDFVPYVAGIAAIIIMFRIYDQLDIGQWWNRKFHFVIATLVLITSIHQIYTGEKNKSISYLLFADVIFGIMTFMYVYFTCPKY